MGVSFGLEFCLGGSFVWVGISFGWEFRLDWSFVRCFVRCFVRGRSFVREKIWLGKNFGGNFFWLGLGVWFGLGV